MNGEEELSGPLGYFQRFFREGSLSCRIVLVAYFAVFMLTPLYGLPEAEEEVKTLSATVVVMLAIVQVMALLVLLLFNKKVPQGLKRTGRYIFLAILTPFVLFTLSFVLTVSIGKVPFWLLRAMTSVAMTVPLILVIFVLVQSIIYMGRNIRVPRLPIFLAFVMIFLLIYTFGTFYYINGLIIKDNGTPLSFDDSLYASGLAFTSLGFIDSHPIGFGKLLAIFESISGYITIALITTIFLQIILGRSQGD